MAQQQQSNMVKPQKVGGTKLTGSMKPILHGERLPNGGWPKGTVPMKTKGPISTGSLEAASRANPSGEVKAPKIGKTVKSDKKMKNIGKSTKPVKLIKVAPKSMKTPSLSAVQKSVKKSMGY
jgi:hypothetical protein